MTPGTAVDPDVLADGRANNLTVVLTDGEAVAFAWIDLSTGQAGTCMASLDGCGAALARIAAANPKARLLIVDGLGGINSANGT